MPLNVAQKLITAHLVDGSLRAGTPITLKIDQTLTQDATGTLVSAPLREWFDRLANRNGLCCAFADGVSVQDVDWDTQDGHYRVRIQGEWIVVPDDSVVTEPNRFASSGYSLGRMSEND